MKSLLVALLPLVAAQCPYAAVDKRDLLGSRQEPSEPSTETLSNSFGKCSRLSDAAGGGSRSRDWWPCTLKLDVLRQNAPGSNPLGVDFDYAAAFATLDYAALKADLVTLMKTSQPWWPADYGHYGPFFIRLAWHSAGTYRAIDGRGGGGQGQLRFSPLNSWPDNGNLDKARRLLLGVKQKYGLAISWADLILLAGNVALEDMGFPVLGFGAGRPDTWQADESVYWGSETNLFPQGNDVRYNGSTDYASRAPNLQEPLGATHQGLIYVNPEGPDANGDPMTSALDIRVAFKRMGMNDTETVALIVGGHAFGKTHGAGVGTSGPPPAGAPLEDQDLGFKSSYGTGIGPDTVTSGPEVIWSTTPTKWSNSFLESLYGNVWTMGSSPAGAKQFEALSGNLSYPEPFGNGSRRATMLVSDIALKDDPAYGVITRAWLQDFKGLETAFAEAWFKLTHRDMGPLCRYLGPEVPQRTFIWQDPLPASSNPTAPSADQQAEIKKQCLAAPDVTIPGLVGLAWASASTYRDGDKRGGANGARIALEPQVSWEVNSQVLPTLNALKAIQQSIGSVSLADVIVLGGIAAIEHATFLAGRTVSVPFTPGRVDAIQADTDTESVELLRPQADGFRNFHNSSGWALASTEELLVDKAQTLTLTTTEMTVLVGGLRALNANFDGSSTGILTATPGQLNANFFKNLLDMETVWTAADASGQTFTGTVRSSGQQKWTASRADLIFGSQSELRAISEVYAQAGTEQLFLDSFAKAWAKVMDLDRFDVK